MNSRQLQLFAVLVALMLIVGSASPIEAGTAEMSFCASEMSAWPPTPAQGNAACQGEGTCPDNCSDYITGPEYARCHYTITANADDEGDWEFHTDSPTAVDSCQDPSGDCEANSATTIASVTTQETATTSVGVSLSTSVGLSAKAALLAAVSVEVEAGFTTSTSNSSSVSKTFTQSGTLGAPCCGYKIGHHSAFRKDKPASGTIVLRAQMQCQDADGNLCDGTNWHILLSESIPISLAAKDTANKWTVCPATCTTVHQCCDGSSTETPVPPCDYQTWGP
jgi:hypothetical protein